MKDSIVDLLDRLFGNIFRIPLRILCDITGKSNLVMAIYPFWGSPAFITMAAVAQIRVGLYLAAVFWLTCACIMTWMGLILTKELLVADREIKNNGETLLPQFVANSQRASLRPLRVYIMCAAILLLLLSSQVHGEYAVGLVALCSGMMMLSLACTIYWLSEYIPPGKSLFSRAKSWAKNLGSARTTPKLAPGIAGA